MPEAELILASGSAVRARLLTNAGVRFRIEKSGVDESAVKASAGDNVPPAEIALRLAAAKARAVSEKRGGALVIGADQMLECGGKLFDKPADMAAAAANLRQFSGRTHRLITACCLMRDGGTVWESVETARLTMRDLTGGDIEAYLSAAGEDVLGSVGCYRLEELGIRLFSGIDGDFFAILGLPLLGLLARLREQGVAGL